MEANRFGRIAGLVRTYRAFRAFRAAAFRVVFPELDAGSGYRNGSSGSLPRLNWGETGGTLGDKE